MPAEEGWTGLANFNGHHTLINTPMTQASPLLNGLGGPDLNHRICARLMLELQTDRVGCSSAVRTFEWILLVGE
jgi:hypothetical protein